MASSPSTVIERADQLQHELHVHQTELESQNEELRRTQAALAARDRYLDLFDFAPAGYFTLDQEGVILACKRTGAEMLGAQRSRVKGAHRARCIVPSDRDRWHLYPRRGLQDDEPQRIAVSTMQLHEQLWQRLSALKMALAALSPGGSETVFRERVGGMLASLDEVLAGVRRIAQDLRPPMLDDLGLVASIDWLLRDTARRLGLPLTLSLGPETQALSAKTRLAVYRVQAQAGPNVHLDPKSVSTLEHRARLLRGQLVIDRPGEHTRWLGLELSIPLRGHEQAKPPARAVR